MDGDDPDLEAFESNLRPILRARELGKTVALVSSLFLNLSDPQKICVSSIVYAQIPLWHITSHCQSDSDVTWWSRKIQNGSLKGTSTYPSLATSQQVKTNEDTVLAAVEEQYLPTVPVPVHCMEIVELLH